jgi:hypothetical protein
MLKLILTGIWVAIVALGAVYFSIEMSRPPDPAAEEAKKKAQQELVRGEMVTFPVIADGRVEGYFLTKTSYVADKTKLAEITLPIPEILTDELYTALVGDQIIRVGENRTFNLKAFKERVKLALNTRLGAEVVLDVIIEQIDYLSKDALQSSLDQTKMTANGTEKIIAEKVPEGLSEAKPTEGH